VCLFSWRTRMRDVAKRLISSRRPWPEPPVRGWDRRYKARSGPPLPFATVCIPMHRIATSIAAASQLNQISGVLPFPAFAQSPPCFSWPVQSRVMLLTITSTVASRCKSKLNARVCPSFRSSATRNASRRRPCDGRSRAQRSATSSEARIPPSTGYKSASLRCSARKRGPGPGRAQLDGVGRGLLPLPRTPA
jgi:hypothetical protein